MTRRVHVWVSGRVQGVFFRATTREEARRLGLTGWARNLPDGRVEVVAEGEPRAIETLIAFLEHGAPPARVSGIEQLEEEPTGRFTGFDVR